MRSLALVLACVVGSLVVPAPADAKPPAARNDRYSAEEDQTLVVKAPGVLRNDPGRHRVRSLTVVKAPSHGTVTLGRKGGLRYRPDPDWSGRDTFLYRATDRTGRRSVAMVRVAVKAVDDPTTTGADEAAVLEDGRVSGNVLANDTDRDSTLRVASYDASRAPGAFAVGAGGGWTYAPAPDWTGVATVGYTTDTGATGTLTVTVDPVDDPTVTVADEATAEVDGPEITGNVLANDIDVDSVLSVVDVTGPGSWGFDPDGTWTFTPDESGVVTLTYTTNTGATGTLTITVG